MGEEVWRGHPVPIDVTGDLGMSLGFGGSRGRHSESFEANIWLLLGVRVEDGENFSGAEK